MRDLVMIAAVLVVASSGCGSAPTRSPAATTSVRTQTSATAAPAAQAASHGFVPAGNELNNREWASLFWLSIILLSLILWRQTRGIVLGVVPTVASLWIVWLVFTGLLAWTVVLVLTAYRFRLWSTDLIKDTVIWCASAAVALFLGLTNVSRRPHFFRRAAVATLGFTPLLIFYLNLYVFPLPVELVSQPVITILVLTSVVPADERNRPAKILVNGLLSVMGLAVLVFTTVNLIQNWQQIDWLDTLRRLVLPIWLTLGALPCLYAISLFFNYQQAFRLLRWASHDPVAIRRAQVALLTVLHVRTRLVGSFDGGWAARLAGASSLRQARGVLYEFHVSRSGTTKGSG